MENCPECGAILAYEGSGLHINLRVLECSECSYTRLTDTKQEDVIHN